jgi:hypothetical protein
VNCFLCFGLLIAGSSQQPFLGQASVCTGTYSLGETSQAQVQHSRTKVCTGTYSLGETSQAQVPPSGTKRVGTPPSRLPSTEAAPSATTPTKSSRLTSTEAGPTATTPTKSSRLTSTEAADGVTTPTKSPSRSPSKSPQKSLFTTLVLGIPKSADAPGQSSEAFATEVSQLQAVNDTIVSTPGKNQEHGSQEHGSQASSAHDEPMQEEVNDRPRGKDAEIDPAEDNPRLDVSKDDEVAKLKATIAELTKQQASKGVVRRPPAFVPDPGKPLDASQKTRSVADVETSGNPTSRTTRNKSKFEKVRTRADGPSETLEVMGGGSKKTKKKKK